MRDGVLRQKRRLQPDFGADPFAFSVRRVERVIAASAAAELGTKIGALDLSNCRSLRQASSPTVPETSILSFTNAISKIVSPKRHKATEKMKILEPRVSVVDRSYAANR